MRIWEYESVRAWSMRERYYDPIILWDFETTMVGFYKTMILWYSGTMILWDCELCYYESKWYYIALVLRVCFLYVINTCISLLSFFFFFFVFLKCFSWLFLYLGNVFLRYHPSYNSLLAPSYPHSHQIICFIDCFRKPSSSLSGYHGDAEIVVVTAILWL